MKYLKSLILAIVALVAGLAAKADTMDSEGYPVMYVRGEMTNGWSCQNEYRFTRSGNTYTLTLSQMDGQFKIAGDGWILNLGSAQRDVEHINTATTTLGRQDGLNFRADNLRDVTIKFELAFTQGNPTLGDTYIQISANGVQAPEPPKPGLPISGTLPVLYINVYNEDGTTFNDEIIDRNLAHKDYFAGNYWLDLNGCEWLADLGAESIGSEEEPLPLEIKARGNYTRIGFSKKPFKLKLGKKQSLLGLTSNKHFALLAHADDNCGYLRNFVGFNLGRRIGLPWTPWQQPVEVVINGDYRGLYFLTESIRVDKKRINITELADNVEDPALASGGYIVELDNYDEENQISMEERVNPAVAGQHYVDVLRVTPDTPEFYSDLQRRFVTDQFSAMNERIGNGTDNLWQLLDLDDAARYYVVEEIISHTESYHGSTYLFRDNGEGKKWHFSPMWDCGNAFNGSTTDFFYNCDPFGNTWIPSLRCMKSFNDKVRDTWMWFMSTQYHGIVDDIDTYVAHITAAAAADHARWGAAPLPDSYAASPVVNNTDMKARRDRVVAHLNDKTAWLRSQWGDYSALSAPYTEPERDNTAAEPLPGYVSAVDNLLSDSEAADADTPITYFDLQGRIIAKPAAGNIYIARRGFRSVLVRF